MTQPQQDATLNGDALRSAREAKGLTEGDLAIRTCMSTRQIRQLEEGGTSSFYSLQVKLTAARRVAEVLGLSSDQLFIQPHVVVQAEPEVPSVSTVAVGMVSQAETDALVGMSMDNEPVTADLPAASEPLEISSPTVTSSAEPTSSKLSVWFIVALFGLAIGVAALMQPASSPAPISGETSVPSVPAEQDASDQQTADQAVITPSATPAVRTTVAIPTSASAPALPKPMSSASAATGVPEASSSALGAASKAP